MAPQPGVANPQRRFIITRLDGNVETNVIASNPLGPNYTSDQVIRAGTIDNAQQYLADNPGVIIFIYSPTDGAYWTDGDRVWDSRYQGYPV